MRMLRMLAILHMQDLQLMGVHQQLMDILLQVECQGLQIQI